MIPAACTRLFTAPACTLPRQAGTASAARALTPLNQALCDRLADLSPHHPHGQRATELERLYQDHADALATQWRALGAAGRDPQQAGTHRLNRSLGVNLAAVLQHGPRLLRAFAPAHEGGAGTAGDPSLAVWQRRLLVGSARVFDSLPHWPGLHAQALALAALVAPSAHRPLGLRLPRPEDEHEVERLRAQVGREDLLDLQAVLQLRDHAHVDSGSFNFYRAVDLLDRLVPGVGVGPLFEDLTAPLASSLRRLWALPALRCEGEVRKGWIATQALALTPGTTFETRRPLSATARAGASYLLRTAPDLRRYDVELCLSDGDGPAGRLKAVHVALFNAPRTVDEAEVMVLAGQEFRVVSAVAEDLRDATGLQPVTRCIARKVGEPHVP